MPAGQGIGIPGGAAPEVGAHLARIVAALAEAGLAVSPRREMTPVPRAWGLPPLAGIDRAGLPALGLPAFGVHVNGYVRNAHGIHLWVGRRARDRLVAPGKLDHLVAGGIPMGLTAFQTVIKEAEEEASLPAEIAGRARPVGAITYRLALPEGLRNDTLFVFDLELETGIAPASNDGEVEGFELWPIDRVIETVRETDDFKFNVNLVLIDFLIRHGMLDPDREPDYTALVRGLRR
jgi:8-oxo-dGTP pyrophosphatase MutT (NUDIX family)